MELSDRPDITNEFIQQHQRQDRQTNRHVMPAERTKSVCNEGKGKKAFYVREADCEELLVLAGLICNMENKENLLIKISCNFMYLKNV